MTNTLKLNRVVDDNIGNNESAQKRADRLGINISSNGYRGKNRNSRGRVVERFENEDSIAQSVGNVALTPMDNVNLVASPVNGNGIGNHVEHENDCFDVDDQAALLKANQLKVSDQNPFFSGEEPVYSKENNKSRKRGMGLFGRNARKQRNKEGRSSGDSRYV
jgi:hypothetical protein